MPTSNDPRIQDIDLNALNSAVQNQSGVISKLFPVAQPVAAPRTVQRAPGAATGISTLNNATPVNPQGFQPIIRKLADAQKSIAAPATQPAAAQSQAAPSQQTGIAAPPQGVPKPATTGKPRGKIASIAQPQAQPALTPTTERPFDGLAAYQNRIGQEMRAARQQAEQAYHANETNLAMQEYKQKFGVDFSPKYDGDRPENYRNYAQVDAARKRFSALGQNTLTPQQANQTFIDYEQSPEAARSIKSIADMTAAGKVYDPMAGAEPVQELRGPISVQTPDGVQIMEGTQRNEISRPFEGQYMKQAEIDATTGARKKVGAPLTVGEANATGKETVGLIGELARVQGAKDVANINESGANARHNFATNQISQIGLKVLQGKATPEETARYQSMFGDKNLRDNFATGTTKTYNEFGQVVGEEPYVIDLRTGQPTGKQGVLGGTAPPPQAIEYLKQNPGVAAQFDAKYGQGAAAQYLKAK